MGRSATFEEYGELRSSLLAAADSIESVWRRASRAGGEAVDVLRDGEADASPVEAALDDARARLTSAKVEIGIFGDVNRGKSTLLNALLGVEASSMRVTPTTAVPVWVEQGDDTAEVFFVDGTSVALDPATARDMATQKGLAALTKNQAAPIRIVQRLRCSWLDEGLRIIDTPGLDDPSLAAEYEELALAELDRVAAAILVLSVPPGIAASEVRVLRGLASRRIDKLFVVCNFHSDQWKDPETRTQVREHVVGVLRAAVDDELADVNVFEVHAKQGLEATLKGNRKAFASSGVAALRDSLEHYLTEEVLHRLGRTVRLRLGDAVALTRQQLDHRRELLSEPKHLAAARNEHKKRVRTAADQLESVCGEIESRCAKLGSEVGRILAEPWDEALRILGAAATVADVEDLQRRLRINGEAAASKASSYFRSASDQIDADARDLLYRSFGTRELGARSRGDRGFESLPAGVEMPGRLTQTDTGTILASIGSVALTGGVIGGALAGGIGVALVAAGPVGWLIGAGIGLATGGLLGGGAAALLTKNRVTAEARVELQSRLNTARSGAVSAAKAGAADLALGYVRDLRGQQDRYFGDEQRELERVERLAEDRPGIAAAIADIDDLLGELNAVR